MSLKVFVENVEGAAKHVSDNLDSAAEVLPHLPSAPHIPLEAGITKREHGLVQINQLQEMRRQNEPAYDPAGVRMSKQTERLSKLGYHGLLSSTNCIKLCVLSSTYLLLRAYLSSLCLLFSNLA
jgi:hypothetical protein